MFNFFTSIANLIETVITFVISFFTSLIAVIGRAVQALAYIVVMIGLMPNYVRVFILAMVGVSAILFVINKGSD